MSPRTAGFGNRDRFELNGKIGLHRAAGLIVLRECRQWQHNVARNIKGAHFAVGCGYSHHILVMETSRVMLVR